MPQIDAERRLLFTFGVDPCYFWLDLLRFLGNKPWTHSILVVH
jgi:hypothetical protein